MDLRHTIGKAIVILKTFKKAPSAADYFFHIIAYDMRLNCLSPSRKNDVTDVAGDLLSVFQPKHLRSTSLNQEIDVRILIIRFHSDQANQQHVWRV